MFYPASRPNVSEGHGQWPFSLCGIHGLAIEEGMANILQRNSETAMLRRHSGSAFPCCLYVLLIFEQKHIKRKEYYSSSQFADDVELVFSNALTFNQDHTPIWNDAVTLRVRTWSGVILLSKMA